MIKRYETKQIPSFSGRPFWINPICPPQGVDSCGHPFQNWSLWPTLTTKNWRFCPTCKYFDPYPRSHQTRPQYVLQNVAERGQTVCEWNERCDNSLGSFFPNLMDVLWTQWTGWNGKDIPERRYCSKSWGDHPVPKLDGVTTCLKRDGGSTNGIAVLRTY